MMRPVTILVLIVVVTVIVVSTSINWAAVSALPIGGICCSGNKKQPGKSPAADANTSSPALVT